MVAHHFSDHIAILLSDDSTDKPVESCILIKTKDALGWIRHLSEIAKKLGFDIPGPAEPLSPHEQKARELARQLIAYADEAVVEAAKE